MCRGSIIVIQQLGTHTPMAAIYTYVGSTEGVAAAMVMGKPPLHLQLCVRLRACWTHTHRHTQLHCLLFNSHFDFPPSLLLLRAVLQLLYPLSPSLVSFLGLTLILAQVEFLQRVTRWDIHTRTHQADTACKTARTARATPTRTEGGAGVGQ